FLVQIGFDNRGCAQSRDLISGVDGAMLHRGRRFRNFRIRYRSRNHLFSWGAQALDLRLQRLREVVVFG
ncbi:hypothetical protein ABE530_19400, partial [Brucella sp. TWI559]